MAKRPPKSEKLKEKMKELESQIAEEEAKEEQAYLDSIVQTIQKTGIAKHRIPKEQVEAALKKLLPSK